MIAAVACCLLVAGVMILLAPALLRGDWVVHRPRLAISAWLTVFATGGAALVASVAIALVAVLAHPGASSAGASTAGSGAGASAGWATPVVATIVGWAGLGAIGALVALVLTRAEDLSIAGRRTSTSVTLACALSAYRWDDLRGIELCFVEADRLTAVATRAGGRRILISRRTEETLSPAQLRVVLEHEAAHLTGGHDRLLALARLNRSCFPRLAGARGFERTVRLLIELIADDAAARRCGTVTAADAITAMRALDPDPSLQLRAARLLAAAARSAADRSAALHESRRIRRAGAAARRVAP